MKAKNLKISGETPTTRRFQALFDSGLLTDKDRSFLDSLLSSYRSSGSLTAGRRSALAKVEARISEAKVNPPTIDASSITRVESLISTGKLNSWGLSFANSVLSQAKVGRALSANQVNTLVKLENEIKDQAAFSQSFSVEDRDLFARAVNYYRSNGYFGNVIAAFDADPNYVPSPVIFAKMTGNAYFKKVVEAEEAPAKFAEGQFVGLSSTIGNSRRGCSILQEVANSLGITYGDAATTRKDLRGMILVNDGLTVVSAVRGAKPYKVLFFGASRPVLVEERHLVRSK
jgi:hypothetical protein